MTHESQERERVLREQIERASRADTARDVLREAMEALEAEALETFKRSNPHDRGGHMMMSLYLRVLNDVEQYLQTAIAGGDVAKQRLMRMPKPESRLRRTINGIV